MMPTCLTPFRSVFKAGTIPTLLQHTMTKNINDLLDYYGKLERQEAKRKQKTHHQDHSKSQQQPARNQNQHCQGNQNQCNRNNHCNEDSFLLLSSAPRTFKCQMLQPLQSKRSKCQQRPTQQSEKQLQPQPPTRSQLPNNWDNRSNQ